MDESKPLLVDTGRGFSIQYKGRWLYSRRDPGAAPLAAALATPTRPETLYVVHSPCLCHGLRELLEQLPASSAVLCIEVDSHLRSIATQIVADEFPGVTISSPLNAIAAYRTLEQGLAPVRFRRALEVRLSGGRALHEAEYDRALAAIDADIQVRFRNRLALVRMGRLWTKNIIANLGSMRWEAVSPIHAGGKPVVVCGAGPSLDEALPVLRAHRETLFILACDTASGALAQAGVVPDAVVCLEGQIYNVEDFLPLQGKPTTLIADLTSHPSSYRALPGPLNLTLSEYTESAFLSRLAASGLPVTLVPPLGSVGVLAIRIARLLGGRILVTGLDFAFNQGKTHCSGSPADLRARRRESRTDKRGAAWASSFRDGCTRKPDGSLTDPALSMYASLAAGELRSLEGWDLRGGFGASLPLRTIAPGDIEALAESKSVLEDVKTLGTSIDPGTCRKKAHDFLTGELARAENVASALRTGTSTERLTTLLADADFLYFHFPDPERVLALEPDALRRVAAEAAYWRGRLAAALRQS
jgi:hypothetical protein